MPDKYCACKCHDGLSVMCTLRRPCCPEPHAARSELKPLVDKKPEHKYAFPPMPPMPQQKTLFTKEEEKDKGDA